VQYLTPVIHPWDLVKDDVVYATFDYMQRGLGNGSCGPGIESQYHCTSYETVSHKMRISTVNGNETGIGNVPASAGVVEYDAESQTLRCAGLPQGAEVTVVNYGGVQLGKAAAVAGEAVVALQGQPKAAYIALIKVAGSVRSHRFIKW
jgi:beta-galactosidase